MSLTSVEAESKRGRTEGVTHGDKYSCRFCICVIVPSQQNHTHFLNNWCSAGSGYVVHRVCSVVPLLWEKFNNTKLHLCFLTEQYTCHDIFTSSSRASLCASHGHGINEVSAWCSVYGVPMALFMYSVQAAHWIQVNEEEFITNDLKVNCSKWAVVKGTLWTSWAQATGA